MIFKSKYRKERFFSQAARDFYDVGYESALNDIIKMFENRFIGDGND